MSSSQAVMTFPRADLRSHRKPQAHFENLTRIKLILPTYAPQLPLAKSQPHGANSEDLGCIFSNTCL